MRLNKCKAVEQHKKIKRKFWISAYLAIWRQRGPRCIGPNVEPQSLNISGEGHLSANSRGVMSNVLSLVQVHGTSWRRESEGKCRQFKLQWSCSIWRDWKDEQMWDSEAFKHSNVSTLSTISSGSCKYCLNNFEYIWISNGTQRELFSSPRYAEVKARCPRFDLVDGRSCHLQHLARIHDKERTNFAACPRKQWGLDPCPD
jgi:hypothetical protein